MTSAAGRARGRFLLPLLIGDVVTVTLFTALGMLEHRTVAGFSSVLVTATPFLIAWIAVGLWLGVFWERAVTTVGIAVRSILLPWILTVPIALQLRTLMLQRGAPISFALVVLGLGGMFLIGWRIIYTVLRRKPKSA